MSYIIIRRWLLAKGTGEAIGIAEVPFEKNDNILKLDVFHARGKHAGVYWITKAEFETYKEFAFPVFGWCGHNSTGMGYYVTLFDHKYFYINERMKVVPKQPPPWK